MSEVCHHASIRALSHVQGLNFSPQDIETSIPTKDRRFTKNKFTANVKAQRGFWNLDVNEKNLPFDLRSLPIFKGEKKTQQTWSQGGIRHLSLMLMKTTKGLKEKTYLSMDTSTFMEWFSSGNFTRSLKWLSQVQNVRAWEIWRWWRQKCKKKQETRNAPKVTAWKKMRWLCRNATNFQTYSHYFTIDSLFTWWK